MSYQGRLSGAETWTIDGAPGSPAIWPPYFGPRLQTLGGAFGSQLDSRAEQVLLGRLAAIPFAGGANPGRVGAARLADGRIIECEEAALPAHAADRGLLLYPSEGPLSQRVRLSQWHQLHQQRGTLWGTIAHVRPYFTDAVAAGFAYPQITIAWQTNEVTPAAIWYRVDPSGARTIRRVSPSNLNYDGVAAKRTRWLMLIEMAGTGYTLPALWGGFSWGDGTLWGQGGARPFTAGQQADVAAMAGDWKAAHSWLLGVALIWPGYTALSTTGTPTQDADGRWSLPNGANTWGVLADPGTGKATRPAGWQWILDNGSG